MTQPKRKIHRVVNLVVWSIIGFFALGYFLTNWMGSPILSMPLAAMAVIPYGVRICRPLRAGLVGLGLGTVAGLAIANSLAGGVPLAGRDMLALAGTYVGATAVLCTAVAALFGYSGRRRRQAIERQWKA